MSEKMFNTRIIHKHDTAENWAKAISFIPKIGELIVYDPDENFGYARTKMGDGITKVNDLPFINSQSNWLQNNSNANDYVKNRTHYKYFSGGKKIVDNLTFTVDEDNSYTLADFTEKFVPGDQYTVYYDGEGYEIIAVNMIDEFNGITSETKQGWYDFSEYPFCIYTSQYKNELKINCSTSGSHTLTIYKSDVYYQKLGIEYLPVATDDEIIEMLGAENIDMLPAVTDAEGAMLTDENDNILMW